MTTPPASVTDLDPRWLSAALDTPIHAVDPVRIGTGQMGSCFRLRLDGPEVGGRIPQTVLAKLPAEDPAARAMVAGTYRGEVRFYTEVAPTLDIRVPHCHHATEVDDEGRFALLLEDVVAGRVGDQLAGCTPGEAIAAAENLAGLHGPRWCDPTLTEVEGFTIAGPEDAELMAGFLPSALDTFLDPQAGIGALVAAEDAATLREASPVLPGFLLARRERFAVTHGDYRLDNLLFLPDGSSVALDWQTVGLGLPARDLAFLVTTGLSVEDRRACERDVVAAYHARLAAYGVAQDLAECWDDYRLGALTGLLVEVFGCAFGARTERGDRMFATMLARTCAAIRDLDALALARG